MKIISDYTDFQGFISDLYKYPYLVNINNVEVYPYPKNKKILLINLSITLYASKSADETANEENQQNQENPQ